MVELGAAASILQLGVSLRELYECRDQGFLAFVRTVANRVQEHHDQQ